MASSLKGKVLCPSLYVCGRCSEWRILDSNIRKFYCAACDLYNCAKCNFVSKEEECHICRETSIQHFGYICLTPNCMGWCISDENNDSFRCVYCANYNCLKCNKVSDEEECSLCSRSSVIHPMFESSYSCFSESCMGLCILDQEHTCNVCYGHYLASGGEKCLTPFLCRVRRFYFTGPKRKIKVEDDNGPPSDNSGLVGLHLDDSDASIEEFQCPLCLTDFENGEGIFLKECFHRFCRPCLMKTYDLSEAPEIKCPFVDGINTCKNVLSQQEVKSLVPPDIFEKYLARRLGEAERQMGDAYHCKDPGCAGWGIRFAEDVMFECEVCGHINCIECETIHEGVTCADYQATKHVSDTEAATKEVLQGVNFDPWNKIDECEIGFLCGTPNCKGICIVEDDLETFYCPICDNYNCRRCYEVFEFEECPYCVEENVFEKDEAADSLDYAGLCKLYEEDIISNLEKFQCPICITDIEIGEGIVLKECIHSFCRPCFINAVDFSESPEMKCPFGDGVITCDNVLSQQEVKAVVPPEIFEKYLARSLGIAERQMGDDAYHCKSPDCPGWGIRLAEDVEFVCEVCGHINCIKCETIHEGATCADYQATKHLNDTDASTKAVLQKILSSQTGMPCPRCKIIIMKIDGCDGMQCTACLTHICWATRGPRWGPDGRGDASGGCHCMENGVRCHESCGNCH